MAARRCSICAINYPTSEYTCQVCNEATAYIDNIEVHEDWQWRVAELHDMIDGKTPTGPKALPGLKPSVIVEYEGQHYIHDENLDGYFAAAGTIIRVQGTTGDIFFELYGRAFDKGRPQPGWWIKRVDPEGWVPDFIPEDGAQT